MSEYTPTVWRTGDVITAEKLNNIEEGIANAEGGASDFSTAEVTLISAEEFVDVIIPCIINDEITGFSSPDVGTYTVPLYKNKAILNVMNLYSISVSGDAEYIDDDLPVIIVSGDCSITFTPTTPES